MPATPILARNYSATTLPTSLTANIDNNTTTTNIPVVSTVGFPATPFTGCFERNTPNQEFVLVTNVPDPNHFIVVRGYDGTPCVAHNSSAAFEHTVGAMDYRESNWHHTDTTRDDHLQYALTNGTRAFTGPTLAPGVGSNLTATTGRYVGSTNGAPTTGGPYLINDYASDVTNRCFWFCITAGSPGTWSNSRVMPCARLQATSQSVLAPNTWGQITSLAQDHAIGGCTTASNAIRLPISGVYRVSCSILWQAANNPPAAGRYVAAIYRNGGMVRQYNSFTSAAAFVQPGGSDTGQYAAGDLITLWGWQSSSGNEGTYGSGIYTNLAVEFVSYLMT